MKIMINDRMFEAVHHFSSGFDYSNRVNSFHGSKYLPKI